MKVARDSSVIMWAYLRKSIAVAGIVKIILGGVHNELNNK